MNLTGDLPDLPVPDGALVKEVNRDELTALRQGKTDLPSEFYRDELGVNDRCFVCTICDELAFICWIRTEGSDALLKLGEREAEATYAYCLPRFRGKGLHAVTLNLAAKHLKSEGLRALWGKVHDRNVPAMKNVLRAGFQMVGEKKRLGFFVWGNQFCTSAGESSLIDVGGAPRGK